MPASIFSETELARLAGFPEEIPGDDLIRAFTGAYRDLVAIRRGAANRLGLALQLCALRYLGFVPRNLSAAPRSAACFVADQLEHTTDTAGYTEIVFALFHLLGLQFAPRIRDLGAQRWYRLDAPPRKEGVAVLLKGLVRSKTLLDNWGRTPPGGRLTQVGLGDRIAPDFEAPDWRKRERLVPSPPRSRAPRQDPVHPKGDRIIVVESTAS